MDCSPPGSSVHGISQTRILEWVAISFSRASSQTRDPTGISYIGGGFFTTEPLQNPPSHMWYGPYLQHAQQNVTHLLGGDYMEKTSSYRAILELFLQFSSAQFSRSVVSNSLRPHGLQHARPPCPSPTPGVYSNSCPLS